MEQFQNKPTLTAQVCGMRLKIIRVGKSPRLRMGSISLQKKNMRHIHSHFTYEVFFVTEGRLELVTEGKRTIYEKKVVIIPPHIGHYTTAGSDGCFCLLFSFEGGRTGGDAAMQLRERLQNRICELPLLRDTEYYIRAIARKSEENTVSAEKDAALLAELVFRELMRCLLPEKEEPCRPSSDSKHIGEIETYINANFHKKITLSGVAKHVYLSTRQVSRILKKEYGCTLSQLVNRKKLAAAQMLLKTTDMKIGDISAEVHLGAENYFYTLFKKEYGMSPLQYRKRFTVDSDESKE